jgi:hypothetical protein
MTLSEREAALRRALQRAAASIEPAPDGLERIQARLRRPRPLAIAWLEAAWTDFYLRARAGLQTAGPLLADDVRRLWERFGPASGPARGRRRMLRWLRPLAALSLAAFVFGAGTYVGLNSPTLFPSAPSLNSGSVGPGGSNSGGRGSQGPDGSGSPVGSPGPSGTSTSSSECKKAQTRSSYTPPSSSPSTSPTSTGSPTASITPASPTPSPTPSSSSSTTPNPGDTTSTTGGSPDGTVGTADTGQPGTAVSSDAADTIGTSRARTTTNSASTHDSPARPKISPSGTSSANPCASKTTAAFRPPEVGPAAGEHGTSGVASAQLMAATLETTGAAARLSRPLAS